MCPKYYNVIVEALINIHDRNFFLVRIDYAMSCSILI